MIEPIQSVQARIREIYGRIDEINRKVASVYATLNVNSTQKIYNTSSQQKETVNQKETKTFQEILSEVMQSQREEDSSINIISKPDESLRDIILEGFQNKASGDNNKVSQKFDKIIEEASQKYNIPKELIKAVIKAESNFNPFAISPKNAIGLMQLLPSTAKEMGVEDIFDPYQNIMGGTKYLRMLLDKYNNNLFLALASYNAGPNRVDSSGGIPKIEETENYIERVIRYYKEYSEKAAR